MNSATCSSPTHDNGKRWALDATGRPRGSLSELTRFIGRHPTSVCHEHESIFLQTISWRRLHRHIGPPRPGCLVHGCNDARERHAGLYTTVVTQTRRWRPSIVQSQVRSKLQTGRKRSGLATIARGADPILCVPGHVDGNGDLPHGTRTGAARIHAPSRPRVSSPLSRSVVRASAHLNRPS